MSSLPASTPIESMVMLRSTATQPEQVLAQSEFDEHLGRLMAEILVMMVDDEPLTSEVLQVHLEGEGYRRFTMVGDSREAMQQIRLQQPDVVLLDLVMPHMGGMEILAAIRADRALIHLPVIVLTSSDDAGTRLEALQAGASDFLAKPVNAAELALRMRNIVAARAYQNKVMHYDPLTDLPNRLYFTNLMSRVLVAARHGALHGALILINVNRFKSVNDSFGLETGDEVMRQFSERLLDSFADGKPMVTGRRRSDQDGVPRCVCRLGGDRFAVLMPMKSTDEHEQPAWRMKSFLDALHNPFVVNGQNIFLGCTIGVAVLGPHTGSVEALINDAETAMLHARHRTDTNHAYYNDEMDRDAHRLLSIENGLRTAVQNDEFFLLYQPKVSVADGRMTGVEALLRWNHPTLGPLPPEQFIPVAENTGLIVSIGDWVMRQACLQMTQWHTKGHAGLQVSVNVSIRQLQDPGFIDRVACILQDTQLPGQALIVELTENMLMEKAESNVLLLHALKAMDVRVSVDDFGTGYSSLGYLQRFPIDQLKIDRSFVMEIESNREPVPIVKAVVSLAHDLGMSVVAEGVETEQQLQQLQALACEEYQGFLYSKPVEVSAIERLLKPRGSFWSKLRRA